MTRGRISEKEQAEIKEQAKSLSPEAIAKKYDRSIKAISKVLGVKVEKPAKAEKAPKAPKPAGNVKRGKVSLDEQRAIQEEAKTISAEEIATKHQRSLYVVKDIINSVLKPSKAEVKAAKKAEKAAKKAEKKTARDAKAAEKAAKKAEKKTARDAKKQAKEQAKAAKKAEREAKKAAKASEPAKSGDLIRGKISNAEKDVIREEGKTLSVEEVATKHKRSLSSVTAIINSKPSESAPKLAAKKPTAPSDKPGKRGKISDEEQAEIQQEYQEQHITPEDLAVKHQRSVESILKVLHIKNYVPVVPPEAPKVGFDNNKEYVQFLEDAVQSLLLERGAGNDIPIPHYKNPTNSFTRANILAQIGNESGGE